MGASWLFAGAVVVLAALLRGSLSLESLFALYFGLGAGIELTLFVQGWRAERGTLPRLEPAPLPSREETEELVAVLRALKIPEREALELASHVPAGIGLQESIRIALQHYREARR